MAKERVTVTLPQEIVRDIDRREKNRSRFILHAIQNELIRRQREELIRSIENPHPESLEFAELGMGDWSDRVAEEDEGLLEPRAGRDVRWSPDVGWVEE